MRQSRPIPRPARQTDSLLNGTAAEYGAAAVMREAVHRVFASLIFCLGAAVVFVCLSFLTGCGSASQSERTHYVETRIRDTTITVQVPKIESEFVIERTTDTLWIGSQILNRDTLVNLRVWPKTGRAAVEVRPPAVPVTVRDTVQRTVVVDSKSDSDAGGWGYFFGGAAAAALAALGIILFARK